MEIVRKDQQKFAQRKISAQEKQKKLEYFRALNMYPIKNIDANGEVVEINRAVNMQETVNGIDDAFNKLALNESTVQYTEKKAFR